VDYVTSLASRIQETFDKGGNVLIPSFAVGRTQEMLYFIREIKEKDMVKGHGNFPVYMDSPLAIEATNIFLQCDTQFLDEDMQALIRSGVNPIFFPGLELAVSADESKAINEDIRPKVIISASGMCDAGRIRHHLKHNLWRPECRVLFVGYQAQGTLGRVLVDGANEVKLFNEEIEVNATIDALPGISGHADKMGLINWLGGFETKPKMVFVNHGDPDAADAFTKCLNEELGYTAFAPYSGTVYDLIKEEFEYVAQPIVIEKKFVPSTKAQRIFSQLVAAAERLLKTAKRMEGRPNKMLQDYTKRIENLISEMEN
ncbi:MAG: MBL fold metallo-hydrolase, partial [Oscillospiraceae bacterium]|nr:MBL fold metallo-hydrolase [Oscillospiraceae bacterium]